MGLTPSSPDLYANEPRQGYHEQVESQCFSPTKTWLWGSTISDFPSECSDSRHLFNPQNKTLFRPNINSERKWLKVILSTRFSIQKKGQHGRQRELNAVCIPDTWSAQPGEQDTKQVKQVKQAGAGQASNPEGGARLSLCRHRKSKNLSWVATVRTAFGVEQTGYTAKNGF